jgi:hypothetical protein
VVAETQLGTVVLFEASEDTVMMMHALLTEAGASQSLLRVPLADLSVASPTFGNTSTNTIRKS